MDDNARTVTANPTPGPKNAQPKKRHLWLWIIIAIFLILAFITFLTHRHSAAEAGGGGRGRGGAGVGPTTISTVTAQTGTIGVYINALGTVTPVYTVSVAARVAGQITKVNYTEGQHVKVGDSLVEIDPRPYEASVLQAKGQLDHDNALLENAKLDLDRYRQAFESNAIPQQQYDTQVATVHQDEGSVQLDQGNLDSANVNLAYSSITSPIDGRVGLRLVDPGNIVQANGTTPLAVITQTKPITVIFPVSEDQLSEILPAVHRDPNLPMEIYDRENQAKITTGQLETLDNQIDPATGTLKLRGVCSNEDESLFPNQFVNVRLLVNTLTNITVLPNAAIQRNTDSAFVYLLQPPKEGETNQTVEMHTITVGATDGNVSQVDLDPGAVVAADNFNRLTDGAKVIVRAGGEQSPGQPSGQSQGKKHKKQSQ
jgi:multidrug efflux system membrane fusion protein